MKDSRTKEEIKKEIEAKWKSSVSELREAVKETHITKEYTFTAPEANQLIKLYTSKTFIEQVIEDKLNRDVLGRIGITPTSDTYIDYDLTLGRFVVRAPKKLA